MLCILLFFYADRYRPVTAFQSNLCYVYDISGLMGVYRRGEVTLTRGHGEALRSVGMRVLRPA